MATGRTTQAHPRHEGGQRTECHQDFQEVWHAIDNLRERKQNKVGPVIWLPILLWLFTSSAGIIWGSAALVTKMDGLTTAVKELNETRVDSKDLALRDKDIKANQTSIAELKTAIGRIEAGVSAISKRLSDK